MIDLTAGKAPRHVKLRSRKQRGQTNTTRMRKNVYVNVLHRALKIGVIFWLKGAAKVAVTFQVQESCTRRDPVQKPSKTLWNYHSKPGLVEYSFMQRCVIHYDR